MKLMQARHTMRALWLICALIVAVDAVWLQVTNIALTHAGVARIGAVCAVVLALRAIYGWLRPEPRLCAMLDTVLYLVIFSQAGAVLSYLVVGTGAPLVDAWYAHADAALGLDWMGWFEFVRVRPLLSKILHIAYTLLLPQMVPIVLFLGFSANFERLREFLVTATAAVLVTVFVSALAPASGAWIYHDLRGQVDLAQFSDFIPLRQHVITEIDVTRLQGLISMPSFHTALAMLYAWTMRRHGVWFWLCVSLNGVIVLSTPTEGGHYFVDVLGGAAVTIVVAGWATYESRAGKTSASWANDAGATAVSVIPHLASNQNNGGGTHV